LASKSMFDAKRQYVVRTQRQAGSLPSSLVFVLSETRAKTQYVRRPSSIGGSVESGLIKPGEGRRMIPKFPRKCCRERSLSVRPSPSFPANQSHLVVKQDSATSTHSLVALIMAGCSLNEPSIHASDLGRYIVECLDIRRADLAMNLWNLGEAPLSLEIPWMSSPGSNFAERISFTYRLDLPLLLGRKRL
jgi:hypothetical protein